MFLLIPHELLAQDSSKVFLNVGLITNLEKCSECEKADTGGSIRQGILTKGKMGYYAGYVWFKEYHPEYIEYDDKGSILLAGIDYRIFRRDNLRCYINFGLGIEKFISTYPNRTETESSVKPDIGLLINYRFINTYIGWQPSVPHHYNIGAGFTF
ncbi:hypothetical protein ACFL5D_04700 [Candidatus Neomarinimicrobiota bacterium]